MRYSNFGNLVRRVDEDGQQIVFATVTEHRFFRKRVIDVFCTAGYWRRMDDGKFTGRNEVENLYASHYAKLVFNFEEAQH